MPKAPAMNAISLTAALKDQSLRLGFDLVGATPAVPPATFDCLRQWVADGYAGQMHYLADRLDAYADPGRLLDGAKSILMLGMNYRTAEPVEPRRDQARVSRYAWGADYHDVIRRRLHKLADFHRELIPGAGVRGVVDTAPLLERHHGQQAGLGWIGKNTMLINRRLGGWILLAGLLSTEELDYDRPNTDGGCGSCRACLDACPTGALVEPYRLDARRCISYLTIELRGPIPTDLCAGCAGRLFGCDTCQEACPWNRRTPTSVEPGFQPGVGMNPVEVAEIVALDDEAFRHRFRRTALWRARREGILRNAALSVSSANDTPGHRTGRTQP